MLYGYIIILCLIMVLAGYAVGRRIGIEDGLKKGRACLPIQYKMQYIKEDRCPICGSGKGIYKRN